MENFRERFALRVGCAPVSADPGLLRWVGDVDVAWWELGGQVCAVFHALPTYCLFGTSGLRLHTVLLFVSAASQNACFPQKGIKVFFLRLACATSVILQAQASPGADCRLSTVDSLRSQGPVQWRGLLGRQPAAVLKAAEPLAARCKLCPILPAGVSLPSLETGMHRTSNDTTWRTLKNSEARVPASGFLRSYIWECTLKHQVFLQASVSPSLILVSCED